MDLPFLFTLHTLEDTTDKRRIMGKKIQESYLKLSHAIADLPGGPQCANPDYSEMFFVEPIFDDGHMSMAQMQRKLRQDEIDAKLICDFCPVKTLCAEYAILAHEPFGIWGATTPAERKLISSFSKSSKPGLSKATQLFD
jgi:hypothetical protein